MWLISSFRTPTMQLAVRQRCPEIAKYYNFYTESGEVCRLKSETLIISVSPLCGRLVELQVLFLSFKQKQTSSFSLTQENKDSKADFSPHIHLMFRGSIQYNNN